jgi:pimeloyl-ACP methyl ester carboxylesterase
MQQKQLQLASSGTSMQVIYAEPEQGTTKPLLLFLHGSFHAAWCWAEHWMPYFQSKGYSVAALSWRGTAGTFAGDGVKKVKIMEHVQDLMDLMDALPKVMTNAEAAQKPILVAHSFGGMAVMKLMEEYPERASRLSGVVTICSVPPSGNGKMTMRFLRRSLSDSWKITAGLAMKQILKSTDLCRLLFFGGEKQVLPDGTVNDYGISDDDVVRYQTYFARDSVATTDLLDLAKKLPLLTADKNGTAPFVNKLPPCLVMGAKDDFIVDIEGYDETATYFGVDHALIVDSPHDVMLGAKWQHGADALDKWITSMKLKI